MTEPTEVPKDHPRYSSLITRNRLSKAVDMGLVHKTGLIAHGRGEAFDYLLGEKTIEEAKVQIKAAAALLLIAKKPVISVNGNSVALVPGETLELAREIKAAVEVNLFHPSDERVEKLCQYLEKHNPKGSPILGRKRDAEIPGLSSNRGLCEKGGIFSADVVLVLLEDGDRTEALKKMGKKVICVDLNPLSRTPKKSDIPIIDNVIRAIPNLTREIRLQKGKDIHALEKQVNSFTSSQSLDQVIQEIVNSLKKQ